MTHHQHDRDDDQRPARRRPGQTFAQTASGHAFARVATYRSLGLIGSELVGPVRVAARFGHGAGSTDEKIAAAIAALPAGGARPADEAVPLVVAAIEGLRADGEGLAARTATAKRLGPVSTRNQLRSLSPADLTCAFVADAGRWQLCEPGALPLLLEMQLGAHRRQATVHGTVDRDTARAVLRAIAHAGSGHHWVLQLKGVDDDVDRATTTRYAAIDALAWFDADRGRGWDDLLAYARHTPHARDADN